MKITILTLFPGMFAGPFAESIIGRALERDVCEIDVVDLRSFTTDKHHVADDTPYGGGGGMVMKIEPIVAAVEATRTGQDGERVIFLTPQGRPYDQGKAKELAELEHLILLCGHYEGIDERARELVVDEEVSIGDYVLTGGELPAMVVTDSIVRLLPGALGNEDSYKNDSFWNGILDCPHYTRPEVFRDARVPDVLLSGHHAEIGKWRHQKALERTRNVRPDLLDE